MADIHVGESGPSNAAGVVEFRVYMHFDPPAGVTWPAQPGFVSRAPGVLAAEATALAAGTRLEMIETVRVNFNRPTPLAVAQAEVAALYRRRKAELQEIYRAGLYGFKIATVSDE